MATLHHLDAAVDISSRSHNKLLYKYTTLIYFIYFHIFPFMGSFDILLGVLLNFSRGVVGWSDGAG